MQTADWALVISLCPLFVALASFVWNVWSKFIFPKPTLRVSFGMVTAFHPQRGSEPNPVRALRLSSATNMGPEEVVLRSPPIEIKRYWLSDDIRHPEHAAELPIVDRLRGGIRVRRRRTILGNY